MSSIQQINKNDALRPLLTEVLPYEIPLWFSNTLIHQRATRNRNFLEKLFTGSLGALKPLDYRIKRTNSGLRTLSIMHPVAQLEACDFYESFGDLITFYCRKSQCSLRFPSKIASSFKSKNPTGESNSPLGVEEEGRDSIQCSSYFAYGRYSFLFRFYESYEYQTLEKRFRRMSQVDVAKCFNGIYTHSISWATKSRRVAKRDKAKKGGFDRRFDQLMQNSNYRETNGIIIGPEMSRIFAEIILQEVDVRVIRKLSSSKIEQNRDYDFRRYVDDYFIFTNGEGVYGRFIQALEEELAFFKLHLNEAKTNQIGRPFITNISMFKHEVSSHLDKFYSRRVNGDNLPTRVGNPSRAANRAISDIKGALRKHDVQYASVSNYLLSVIQKKIAQFIRVVAKANERGEPTRDSFMWLLVDLDLIFFIHAMDPRVVPTDKVAKIVKAVVDSSAVHFSDGEETIQKKIFDLGRKSIEIFDDGNNLDFSVEILNILLILSALDERHRLPPSFLEEHFVAHIRRFDYTNIESYDSNGGYYFLWVTIVLYIESQVSYDQLRGDLVDIGSKIVGHCPIGLRSTETLLFFLDYISCPLVPEPDRVRLAEKIISKENLSTTAARLINEFSGRGITVDWNDRSWLENNLLKREYILAYE
ncbi:antiviral reverse transcriptase Drt3b [Actomonas aquatica]|uniref:Antiviral reverse transcriptase Drt3b n=1 Tax=Actomonas aquatica TaxID=2866162 RepID=A0ABZ1CED4_9BACT|nr:antiviral reverse transcriptase Drt3b [Opitutus sp. WL0086]WRQ89991.1 antiviral reverse transcriptase Drt3b [Opitutus sp. WL0086]